MKATYFVVDKLTQKAIASFPSFHKAKSFQIQKYLLTTSEIWGFDPAELHPADKDKTC